MFNGLSINTLWITDQEESDEPPYKLLEQEQKIDVFLIFSSNIPAIELSNNNVTFPQTLVNQVKKKFMSIFET